MGVGRRRAQASTFANDLSTPTPAPPHKGEGKDGYAASALPGFSGGVIAPESLMSATSFSE